MTSRGKLVEDLKAYGPELIAIRRDIHRHPETGFEETRTAALVGEQAARLGRRRRRGDRRTGVVGTITGQAPGPARDRPARRSRRAAHRRRSPGREHRSTVPGKMHACGHDGHTAMLLGAARYLAENRDFGGDGAFHLPAGRGGPRRRPRR